MNNLPAKPALICIGGPPGVGKTTVGLILKDRLPGSVLIDPDAIRLEILGRPPGSAVTEADLAPAITRQVIERMKTGTEAALLQGRTVIVPSAFVLESMRLDFEALAARLQCPFRAFWLEAPSAVITQRQQQRALAKDFNNASQVVSQNPAYTQRQGPLSAGWQTILAGGAADAIAQVILERLNDRGNSQNPLPARSL